MMNAERGTRDSSFIVPLSSLLFAAQVKKWFRHPGIDVRGPERRDDPFWTHMRRFYLYDPAPTLRASKAPLLAIFGELDTPEAVKANVPAIRQILDHAGHRNYIVKVYPNAPVNARHNLMKVPPENPNEYVRRVSSKRWSTGPQHCFRGRAPANQFLNPRSG